MTAPLRHDFTKCRMIWLDQVHSDLSVTSAAFRVAYAIGKGFNRDRYGQTGLLYAWPSQAEIAAETGLTRRGVQKCIEALTETGHLSIEVGGKARGNRSTYEAIVFETQETANERSPYTDKTANAGSPLKDEKSEPEFALNTSSLGRTTVPLGRTGKQLRANGHPHNKSLKQISDKILENSTTPSAKKSSKPTATDGALGVLKILGSVLSRETCAELIAHRKALKAPLTAGAAKGLVKAFEEHGNPEEAASAMMARGWKGFRAEWLADKGPQQPHSAAPRETHLERAMKGYRLDD